MTPEEQDQAFKARVKLEAAERATIQKDTFGEISRLLNVASESIQKKLKSQPSEYAAWYLPQLKKQIETTLLQFGEEAGQAASAGQGKAWEAGQALIDKPLEAANIEIGALLPKLDTGQLLGMQTFLTGKLREVALDTINRANQQLALTMIGTQGVAEAMTNIQAALGGASRRRAQTIVRTELGRAYSTASQLRSEQAAERVPGLKKQWRRSGKIHSRRSHDLTDGQIRPVDRPFILGTGAVAPDMEAAMGPTRIMYPHDPAAPARETINCGCISLPYMDAWAEAGALANPGKKPFTAEEIALNPLNQELAEPGRSIGELIKAREEAGLNIRYASDEAHGTVQSSGKMANKPSIYEAARAGGDYAKFYAKNRDLYLPGLRKASKSYGKVLAEHEEWIKNPYSKVESDKPEDEVRYLVEKKWPKDIARNSAYKAIIDGIIEDRTHGEAD